MAGINKVIIVGNLGGDLFTSKNFSASSFVRKDRK
jgi:single-stranded DNA-binding protein